MTILQLPYQELGANWLATHARTGLFDDMGVGKTAQAIKALDKRAADRNIIACPATARRNWRKEFAKFSTRYRRICVGETMHDFVAWHRGRFDTLITSHDQLTNWAHHIREACEPLEAVILDEGHAYRNPETRRAKEILGPEMLGTGGVFQWAICGWWMTGTPIWNDPVDIYTFLRSCEVMPLDRKAFAARYFRARQRTYSTSHTARTDMLGELRALIANNSLRRTLAQTGVELPPLMATTYLVDGDTEAVRQLLLAHPGLDQMIIDALREGRGLSNLEADHVATLRRLLGEAKALPYAHMLLEELHAGLDKMVVFGIHREALATGNAFMLEHGIGSGLINGTTTNKQDEITLNRFQTDPAMRVVWLNLQSGGTALTMTAACHVDVLESAWTDKANVQAIKRVHRLTQTRGVRARFITLADSFDEVVNEIVAGKAAAEAAIMAAPA